MSRRVSWLRSAVVRPPLVPAAAVEPLRDEAAGYRELLHDCRNELTAANTSLAAERRAVRDLTDQVRAGRKLVAAAEQKCTETCAHARVAAELRIQLAAMEQRLSEVTTASQQRDVADFAARDVTGDWEPRVTVPGQRGRT